MAIELKKLEKGQRISLKKDDGKRLVNFYVGCNWGAVEKKKLFGKKIVDVDLDLSCLMFDSEGNYVDHIWSPLYRMPEGIPSGKVDSRDGALHHTGDDRSGDIGADDGLDNEIITVNLDKVDPEISSIVFFLNIYNTDEFSGDFSDIPYASIRMYEGTLNKVNSVFAQYDVATLRSCRGMRALIMGKLFRKNNEWHFAAIGDAHSDRVISHTIVRVERDYNR